MSMVKKVVRSILRVLYIFPVRNKRIFFLSFDGTKYGFDAKAIIEYINKNEYGCWDMVWGYTGIPDLNSLSIANLRCVKIKSLTGVLNLMTAGTIVYNINAPSYIPYRKNQLLVNTWHGMAYKKVGKYIGENNKKQVNLTNLYLSHASKFTEWALRDSFLYENDVLPCGIPRNDIFFSEKINEVSAIVKEKFGLQESDKIVLFAPTFRGDFKFEDSGLDFNQLRDALHRKFGGHWVVMFRMHPVIAAKYKANYDNVIDVSLFPDMQDLLCAANVFVSDYSGGLWDFSLTKRPVFIFAPDMEEYNLSRGLYMNLTSLPFPLARNNEELQDRILNFDNEVYQKKLIEYFEYMGSYENGNACSSLLAVIHKRHNI